MRGQLRGKGLSVFRERELPKPLRQALSLPLTSLWGKVDLDEVGDKAPVFGDVDIVVARDNQPMVIVSCKLSLHNRLTETLFWSVVYKQVGIRVVLVTPDKGHSGRSEWGSPKRPNKNRQLARRFLSGVYVENHPQFCPPTVKTQFGDIVRPLNQLPQDILRWCF